MQQPLTSTDRRLSRREALAAGVATLGAAALPAWAQSRRTPAATGSGARSMPNILFICVDQLRPYEVGCYGHPTVKTPHLDALAARGIRFGTCVSNNPVCTPARAILTSGQYSRTCAGMMGNWGAPDNARNRFPDATLPEMLAKGGYTPVHLSKWHVQVHPQLLGWNNHPAPTKEPADYRGYFPQKNNVGDKVPSWPDHEMALFDAFIKAPPKGPWMCWHNIYLPHGPWYGVDEKWKKMYSRDDVRMRPNVTPGPTTPYDTKWFEIYWGSKKHNLGIPLPKEDFDIVDCHAMYYGMVSCADAQVGYVMERLKESGQLDNTIVIFTSDHGENLRSHNLYNKETMNEESLLVPLIAAGPGIARGAVNNEQIMSLVDLPATMLALAGIEPPKHFHGVDRSEVLQGKRKTVGENIAFSEGMQDDLCIRTPAHKYTIKMSGNWQNTPPRKIKTDPDRFINLKDDPYEMKNLAGTGDQAPVAKELQARLHEWNAKAPWLAQYRQSRRAGAPA